MATEDLTLTFVRTINNRTSGTSYANRKWIGRDRVNNFQYGYCFKATLPAGIVNSLDINVKVIDQYSGIGNQYWNATYGVIISDTDVTTYNSGIIPDDSSDGTLSLRIYGATNSTGTAMGTITSNKLANYSGKTVYFYIGTLSSTLERYSAVQIHPGASDEEIDLSKNTTVTANYIPYTAVTSPSVVAASTIVAPSGSIGINWSGAKAGVNVSISSFTITIRKSSASGTILYTRTDIDSAATSTTFKISDFSIQPARGDTLFAQIQAIGSVSGYNGVVNGNTVGVINSLPTAPTVNKTGSAINGKTSITFTITKGTDVNSSQALGLKYKIGSSGTLTTLSGTSLTLNINNGLAAGTNTIYFYTNDGLENSPAASTTFTVTYPPEFKTSPTISYTKVASGMNSTASLATTARITYALETDLSNPIFTFQVRTGATSSAASSATAKTVDISNYITINVQTHTITIDIVSISSSIIPYGHYFQFSIKVSNGVDSSDWSSFLTVGQKPALPVAVTIVNIYNDKLSNGPEPLPNYFGNTVTIQLTNPDAAATRPDIKTIQVLAKHSNAVITVGAKTTEGTTYSLVLDLSTVNENDLVSFSVLLTDVAGQTVTTFSSTKLIKTSALQFNGTSMEVSKKIIKPFSNTDSFSIFHSTAFASGTPSENIKFLYKIKIGSVENSISPINSSTTGEQINTTVDSSVFNQLLQGMVTNKNTTYTATITVTAADAFGQTKTQTTSITVDFIEAPTFIKDLTFKIKHDYDIFNPIFDSEVGYEVTIDEDHSNSRMFNAREGIIFVLPKANDFNNDITEYQIFLSRIDVTEEPINSDFSDFVFGATPWLTIKTETLLENPSDTNYYYYRYTASQYTKNEYFYFKIRAKDSKGNYSEEKLCSTYIMGCRTNEPSFEVNNITASIVDNALTVNYDFNITDLGGSAKSNGWNVDFYNNYKNFERAFEGYTSKITLKVETSLSQTFDEVQTTLQTGTSPFLEFQSNGFILENFDSNFNKIFFRFTLYVSYGLNSLEEDGLSYVISIPVIYTYFGTTPTVAHRSHHVGINTSTFSEEDIFVVENYENRKYVVFKGYNQDTGEGYNIVFNTNDGTISGQLTDSTGAISSYLKIEGAVISGGTWS